MPTAGKAAGAILFALLALAVTRLSLPDLPPAVPPAPAQTTAAAVGLLVGWRGAVAAAGGAAAAARGLTTAVAAAFLSLLLGATWLMLRRALRGLYDDPAEALGDAAVLLLGLARVLLAPLPLSVLIAGGMACGVAAAAVARRLP